MVTEDSKKIGQQLKKLRGDLSQKEFAEKLGIPYWTYNRYEKGERTIPAPVIALVASALSVGVDVVLEPRFLEKRSPEEFKQMVGRSKKLSPGERRRILDSYLSRCIYCGFHVESILEIVCLRTETEAESRKLRDYVVLCPNCQKMFEQGLIPPRVLAELQYSVRKSRKRTNK